MIMYPSEKQCEACDRVFIAMHMYETNCTECYEKYTATVEGEG